METEADFDCFFDDLVHFFLVHILLGCRILDSPEVVKGAKHFTIKGYSEPCLSSIPMAIKE